MPHKDPSRRREYEREYWNARPDKRKEKSHRQYLKNSERVNERSRQWAVQHPEIALASRRASEERHREKRREKTRQFMKAQRKAEPEKHRETWRQWKQNNPEKAARTKKLARARRRATQLGSFIEDVEPTVVYEMHGGRCGICGEFISGGFHVDHVIPLSRGGKHGYINVQPAHPSCNTSKGARLPEEMAA